MNYCHKAGTSLDDPCFPGQDAATDCRICGPRNPVMCDPSSPDFANPWY